MKEKHYINLISSLICQNYPKNYFNKAKARDLMKNNKIAIDTREKKTIKLQKVNLWQLKNPRVKIVLIKTSDNNISLFGTLLTIHGGHVAVALSRKIARENKKKLVILERNILCFEILNMKKDNLLDEDLKLSIGSKLGNFVAIAQKFNNRIDALFE